MLVWRSCGQTRMSRSDECIVCNGNQLITSDRFTADDNEKYPCMDEDDLGPDAPGNVASQTRKKNENKNTYIVHEMLSPTHTHTVQSSICVVCISNSLRRGRRDFIYWLEGRKPIIQCCLGEMVNENHSTSTKWLSTEYSRSYARSKPNVNCECGAPTNDLYILCLSSICKCDVCSVPCIYCATPNMDYFNLYKN